jgi:MFS family permease
VRRSDLWRLFAASFAADLQLYLIYTAAPFKAVSLGAGPLALGILAAAATGTYALAVLASGRAGDRSPRLLLARMACLGVILACTGLTLADRLPLLLLLMPLVGASMAFFWPNVQASIADRSAIGGLERDLGRFNLAWSLGKGSGFLLGGMLLSALGAPTTFAVASGIAFLIFFVLPIPQSSLGPIDALLARNTRRAEPGTGAPQAPAADRPPIDRRAPVFRRIAWTANCTAFGLGATLTYHYPGLVAARGWSPRVFGTFLALVYLTQTLAFAYLMRRPETWRFRRLRLYLPQLLMLVAVVALPLADGARLGASALLFGVGLGICYCSSIYYSLLTHEQRGRNAGVHEALIGLGAMTVPLAGGLAARLVGSAWMPYLVAAAAVGVSLVFQEVLHRSGRTMVAVGAGSK